MHLATSCIKVEAGFHLLPLSLVAGLLRIPAGTCHNLVLHGFAPLLHNRVLHLPRIWSLHTKTNAMQCHSAPQAFSLRFPVSDSSVRHCVHQAQGVPHKQRGRVRC